MTPAIQQLFRTAAFLVVIFFLDASLARAHVWYQPGVPGALVVSVLACQIGLASVWAAIGRDNLLARVVVLCAVLAGTLMFLRHWELRAESEMSPGFLVQPAIVICALAILRALRFDVVRAGESNTAAAPVENRPRFSIRDMLILTALVCGALAAVLRMKGLTVNDNTQLVSLLVGAFMASITLAAVFATLVFSHVLTPAVLLVAASVLLGWGIGTVIRYDVWAVVAALGVTTAVEVVVLLSVRLAGYRFVRGAAAPAGGLGVAAPER